MGNPQDGKGPLFKAGVTSRSSATRLKRSAPSVLEREGVNTPLHTGIKAIDAMIPIGRGQRELIIGDRQTGKTAIALDAILNQLNDKCAPHTDLYLRGDRAKRIQDRKDRGDAQKV